MPHSIYTYVSTIAEVLNEGLPRASWCIIGDSSSRTRPQRLVLANTLILTQAILTLIMSLAIFGGAGNFATYFVPDNVREKSVEYVRISSFSALSCEASLVKTA